MDEVSVIDNRSQLERIGSSEDFLWVTGSRNGYEVWRVDHKLHERKSIFSLWLREPKFLYRWKISLNLQAAL